MINLIEQFTKIGLNYKCQFTTLASWCYTYISNAKGMIELRCSDNIVLMLRVQTPIKIKLRNEYSILGSGVYVVGQNVLSKLEVDFNSDTQFLFVDLNMFDEFCVVIPPTGVKIANYQFFLERIFESLKSGEINQNEIFAIINLSLVPEKSVGNEEYNRIVKNIEENFTNPDFSLDDVAGSVYMSKRKIQKILSQKGTTFVKLVKDFRYDRLRHIIKTSTKIHSSAEYIRQSGFPSCFAANVYFKEMHNITVKRYIQSIRN